MTMSDLVASYTLAEVADLLGKSRRTISRWLKAGKFPNATLQAGTQGDQWAIPADDVTALDPRQGTTSQDRQDTTLSPVTSHDKTGATLSDLVSQVTTLSLDLGQAQGERDALTQKVDESARIIAQLTADLEQERTTRHRVEVDAANTAGERDALKSRVLDLTDQRDQLSTDLSETRENAHQEAESLRSEVVDLRDDRDRALTSMGRWSRRKYDRTT